MNTCATSLAFKQPFACDLQCACAADCVSDQIQNGLQMHAQKMYKCKEICDKDETCQKESGVTFEDNKEDCVQGGEQVGLGS